jgi:hypothetical protein
MNAPLRSMQNPDLEKGTGSEELAAALGLIRPLSTCKVLVKGSGGSGDLYRVMDSGARGYMLMQGEEDTVGLALSEAVGNGSWEIYKNL